MITKKNLIGYCKLLAKIIDGEEKNKIELFIKRYSSDKEFRKSINEYVFGNTEQLVPISNQYLHFLRNLSHYIRDEKDMEL